MDKKSANFENKFITACPSCGQNSFLIFQKIDKIPYFGEVLETFCSCSKCLYKTSDILTLSKKKPLKKTILVNEKSLWFRVIKSKYCVIEFPELGIKIEPGPNSEGYITNVEGLIDRIITFIKSLNVILPNKKEEVSKLLDNLEKLKKGELAVHLKVEDETGQSAIIKRVKQEK